MYQIKNDQLSVCVSPVGAQLKSLYSHVTDMEYLWQPGYETWPHSSMLLFPNAGRIARGRVIIRGKVYPANMHGFADNMPFALVEHSETKLVLELRDNEDTLTLREFAPVEARYFRLWVDRPTQDKHDRTVRIYMFQVFRAE